MPNAPPRPWKMFAPLGLVILLAVGWSIYWFAASGIAKQRFSAERAQMAAQGLELACTEEGWGGFPFHFEFSCSAPVLTYAGRAELRSGHLLLVALAYAPWQVVALLDGPTTVMAEGIQPTRAEHQRAIAAVTLNRDGNLQLSSEIPALAVAGLGRAGKVMVHSRPFSAGGTEIALTVSNVDYAPSGKPPLAVDQASLLGILAPDRSFRVEKVEMQKNQLRYWGTGTLQLDSAHRLTGQLITETNDLNSLLTLLGPHLDISDGEKSSLRTMLGLLGSDAKAPLLARDGALYLGPFKVADLRPLY